MPPLLHWLAAHSLHVMAAGVFAGYALPELAEVVAPALPMAIAGMMTMGMMRIPADDLRQTLARWRMLLTLTALLLIACPLMMGVGVQGLGIAPSIGAALILTAACPPLVSTVSLSWMLGFNPPLALALVAVTTLLCPAVLAICLALLPGVGIALDPLELFGRLALLIGGCYGTATLLRHLLGTTVIARAASLWDVLTVALLLLFAVAVMDGVAARASAEPGYVAGLLALAFALNLLLQGAGAVLSSRLGVSSALTVGFACGCRAVGILLAVAPGDASSDVVLFFALYQVPMYTLPSLLRPLYRWLLRRGDDDMV